MEVDVNPISGDPDLYIANTKNLKNNQLINATHNYQWRSMKFGEDNIVILLKNSSFLGIYQIGVYGYSPTKYRLNGWLRKIVSNINETILDSKHVIPLYTGQSRFEYSANNSIHCYVYNVLNTDRVNDDDDELEITVDVHLGVINIYVNFDSIPTLLSSSEEQMIYNKLDVRESLEVPNIIAIQSQNLQNVSNVYTCIQGTQNSMIYDVNSHQNAFYEISVGYKTALKTLQIDGTTSINALNYDEYDYYTIDVISIDTGIYINVESLTDDVSSPFVFISRTNRHPSINDTTCSNEFDFINSVSKQCTMKYTDTSNNNLRIILLHISISWYILYFSL